MQNKHTVASGDLHNLTFSKAVALSLSRAACEPNGYFWSTSHSGPREVAFPITNFILIDDQLATAGRLRWYDNARCKLRRNEGTKFKKYMINCNMSSVTLQYISRLVFSGFSTTLQVYNSPKYYAHACCSQSTHLSLSRYNNSNSTSKFER